jgi:hypothetical protein
MLSGSVTGDPRAILMRERDAISIALRGDVESASASLLAELRGQVEASGLGTRLANAWRRRVFPDNAAVSTLSPAALVWTKAPTIIRAYNEGTIIRPKGGRKALAIPTDWVPLKANRRPMTPVEVEARFNRDLRYVPLPNGRAVLIMDQVIKGRKGGLRRATSRRRGQGRNVTSKVMFVLVRQVTVKKRLDIEAASEAAQGRLAAAVAASTIAAAGV